MNRSSRPAGKPRWLTRPLVHGAGFNRVRSVISEGQLHTVCEEARCPNRGECYASGTATFLILGDRCTRACRFCAISHERPLIPEFDEPSRVADAVNALGLTHAVITSVTRDDLPDGGALHFAATISAIRTACPGIRVEVLIPDLQGDWDSLRIVCEAAPDVIAHNIETVPSLYETVRPGADYRRSLELLAQVSHFNQPIRVKSGMMLGLGETDEEVYEVFDDLREVGCDLLTIGQYLQPRGECVPVERFVSPDAFDEFAGKAYRREFMHVAAGPFVRSSYHAAEALNCCGYTGRCSG